MNPKFIPFFLFSKTTFGTFLYFSNISFDFFISQLKSVKCVHSNSPIRNMLNYLIQS